MASRFGGKRVILACVLGSSLLTLASPVAARTNAYLLAGLRVAVGFLQVIPFIFSAQCRALFLLVVDHCVPAL